MRRHRGLRSMIDMSGFFACHSLSLFFGAPVNGCTEPSRALGTQTRAIPQAPLQSLPELAIFSTRAFPAVTIRWWEQSGPAGGSAPAALPACAAPLHRDSA